MPKKPTAARRARSSRGFGLGSQLTLPILGLMLAIGPLVLGGMRTWILLPVLGLAGILAVIQAGRLWSWARIDRSFSPDAIDFIVITFVIYATVRFCTGPSAYLGRLEWMCILAYAIAFFTTRYAMRHHVHGLTILGIILLVALGVNIFAVWLKANPSFMPYGERLSQHYAPRWLGTYGCPNHYGFFMVMATCIALAFGFFSQFGWTVRILSLYLAAFFVVGAGFSLSRGSWLALLCALSTVSFYAVIKKQVKWWLPMGCLAGVVLLLIFALVEFPIFTQRWNEVTHNLQNNRLAGYVRIVLARDTLKIIQDYPWWGTGPATFVHMHPRYQDSHYSSLATYTHNDYLNLISDYGLVGGLIVLIFLVWVSVKLIQICRLDMDWPDHIPVVVATATWVALAMHSIVDFNMHIPANALIFFTILGLSLQRVSYDKEFTRGFFALPSLSFPIVVLATGLTLLFFVQRTARAYYPVFAAERMMNSIKPDQGLEEALAAAPIDPKSSYATCVLGDYYRRSAAKLKDPKERFPLAQQAELWYRRALEAEPLDETIRVRLAMSLDMMQRFPEAYLYYQKVLKNHPYNGYFWAALGAHHFSRGQFFTAKRAYETSLKCPAGSEEARIGLQKLAEIIKEKEAALDVPTAP